MIDYLEFESILFVTYIVLPSTLKVED